MPKSPTTQMALPFELILHDQVAFNQLIEGRGPTFIHYKALPCPIGQVEHNSIRQPNHDHSDCINGFIYILAGEFKGSFTQNSTTINLSEIGFADGSLATISLPQFYSNGEPIFIAEYDKLYIKDNVVLSTNVEKIQNHITGTDRLTFPVVKVEYIVDSQNKKYGSSDYTIVNGNIVWGDNRPTYDSMNSMGGIYSIRYLYQPYYYVSKLLHEIRIHAQADLEGNLSYVRAPHQILVAREKYFHKKQEEGDTNSLAVPSSGLFGPK